MSSGTEDVRHSQHSVYNATGQARPTHLLEDLVPASLENGWHVARNLRKPLNHLELLRGKEDLAVKLNLHNLLTPKEQFDANFELLREHQARRLTTDRVVQALGRQTGLDTPLVAKWLREYATITHAEFHPTDVCNLSCVECSYGHDDPELKPPPIQFLFHAIDRISQFRPRSIVIIGGGEPTLYKNSGRSFGDVIEELVRTNPGVSLAVVTNGTHRPPGDWVRHIKWIRLSLDASTPETYDSFRGQALFDRVLQNLIRYLETDIPQVGVSFLFAKQNVKEYADVARLVFDLVQKHNPEAIARVNIQYRPLRRDPYRYSEAFEEAVSSSDIERAVQEVRALADSSEQMHSFLRNQTNVTAILGGNSHPPHTFARCYYSQVFHIFRANGDLRPCFIRVHEPEFILGNILRDSPETIALNTLFVGARRLSHCDEHGCRQCHVNYTFEQGLAGTIQPSTSLPVLQDPMF
ncbi:MAG: radical SAM protein [Planctomycetales bacterium]|nr:radical SAM protein [Planctomycetales bacterium]